MRHVDQITHTQAYGYFRNGAAISFREDGREAWHSDTSTEGDFLHRLNQRPGEPVYLVSGYNPDEITQRLMDEFPLSQVEVINGRKTLIRKIGRYNDALFLAVGGQQFSLKFVVESHP